MTSLATSAAMQRHQFTITDYHRMGDVGLLLEDLHTVIKKKPRMAGARPSWFLMAKN